MEITGRVLTSPFTLLIAPQPQTADSITSGYSLNISSEPSRLVRVCIARDIKAKFPTNEEHGETISRFHDPGSGIELRKVCQSEISN